MEQICTKCGKQVGILGNFGNNEQVLCYKCANPEVEAPKSNEIPSGSIPNNTRPAIYFGLIVGILVLFFGFFHIITDHFAIIPKDHFTFSMTFVNLSDIVSQYNDETFGERLKTDALFVHLVRQLENRKLVVPLGASNLWSNVSNNNNNMHSESQGYGRDTRPGRHKGSEYTVTITEEQIEEERNRAIASHFPMELTKIYCLELGYNAENGKYSNSFDKLSDSASGYVLDSVESEYDCFNYSIIANDSQFTAVASVSKAFGNATTDDYATIDQTNSKKATAALLRYAPSWK
jgi:hypothetical protein